MNKCTWTKWILWIAMVCVATECWALEGETDQETIILDEIVVTATKTKKKTEEVPASVEVIDKEDIKQRTAFWADEFMSDLPGVYMKKNNFADFTSSTAMSIRGIEGGERTLILFNGIPLNEPFWGMGHVEFGAIPMDDVQQIDVVKGPFSALYGGNAMAGVINVTTEVPEKDEVVLKTNYSSFNTMHNYFKASKRVNEEWGLAATFDKLTSGGERNAYIDYISISETTDVSGSTKVNGVQSSLDKYGDTQYFVGDVGKQSWDQERIGLAIDFKPSSLHRFSFQSVYSDRTIDHHDGRNYLTDEDGNVFEDGSFYFEQNGQYYTGTVSPTDFLYRARWTPRVEKNIISALSYKGKFGKTDLSSQLGYVTHELQRIKSRRTGATHSGGPAQSNEIDSYSYYFDTNATHPMARHLLTLGASVRYNEANETVNEVSNWTDFDSITLTTSDVEGDNYFYSGYFQGDLFLLDKLELFIGGRYDLWDNSGGTSIARSTDGSQEETIRFDSSSEGQFSPKVALLSRISEDTTLRLSWGKAFRPPTLADLYRTSLVFGTMVSYSNPDLKPETITSYEAGLTQRLFNGRTVINASVFYNDMEDLISGAYMGYEDGLFVYKSINVGRCESQGFEVALHQRLTSWLGISGNYTYTDSEVKENEADPASVGAKLEMVPENMFNLSVDVRYRDFWAKLMFEYADKVYGEGDSSNSQTVWDVYGSYDEIRLLNFKMGYQLNPHTEISYGCKNMLDRLYYSGSGSGISDGRRHLIEVVMRF